MKTSKMIVFFVAVFTTARFAYGTAPMSAAVAQATVQAFHVPTDMAGAKTTLNPPPGFNAITASDVELATYGFPPRPDAQLEPQAYASWERAMLASKVRVTPQLQMTNIFRTPVSKTSAASVTDNASAVPPTGSNGPTSGGWSGYYVLSGAASYNHTNSFYYALAYYVVPKARHALNAPCNNTWNLAYGGVGLDGFGSSDVLEAGVVFDSYLSTSCVNTPYYAFSYEWYPYGSVVVSSVPVTAGDDVFVEVWNTSATQGYVYMVDLFTNQAVTIGVTAYPGYSLVGNSAEWFIDGAAASLTDYTMDFFADCYAYTWSSTAYPATTGTAVTMVNGATTVSLPTPLGTSGIWFQYF